MSDEITDSARGAGVAAEPPAGEASPTSPAPPDATGELNAWFVRHIPNSRYSRDTRAYNAIFNAIAAIKAAMAATRE
jgi:hypothetical protein